MTIQFECPQCQTVFKANADLAGRRVKCRKCTSPILVPTQKPTNVGPVGNHTKRSLPTEPTGDYGDIPPMPVETKQCPSCQAWIKITASKCRYCKARFDIDGRALPPSTTGRRTRKPSERFDVGEVLRATWELYKEEWSTCLVMYLSVSFLLGLAMFLPWIVMGMVMKMMGAGKPGAEPTFAQAVFSMLFLLVYVLLVAGVASYLNCGLIKCALRMAQGMRAGFDDVLGVRSYFLLYLLNVMIFGAIVGIGSILLVVPGLLAMAVLWPVYFTSVDDDVGGGLQPLVRAYEIGKKNIGASALLMLLAVSFYVLGALLCGIGSLVAVPFDVLMFAVAYCHASGSDGE